MVCIILILEIFFIKDKYYELEIFSFLCVLLFLLIFNFLVFVHFYRILYPFIRPDSKFELFLGVLTVLYGEDEISEKKIENKNVFDCDFFERNSNFTFEGKYLTKKSKNINIYQVYNYEQLYIGDKNVLFDGVLIKLPLPLGLTDNFVSFKRKKNNSVNKCNLNEENKYYKVPIPNKKLARIYELYTESPQNALLLLSAFTNLIMKYPGKVLFSVEDGFLNVGLNYTILDGVLFNYKYKKDLKFFIEAMSIIEKINDEGIL